MTVIRLSQSELDTLPWLDLKPEDVPQGGDGPVIVGEMPGKRTDPDCPMFPYPHTSAGGRLMKMSGLDPASYLSSFHRVNLIPRFFKSWPYGEAQKYARSILEEYVGRPIICLGTRVADAFGAASGHYAWYPSTAVTPLVRVPHPSGLNRAYNTPANRDMTGRVLREALLRWHRPAFKLAGDQACACGNRVDTHPRFRPELRVPLHADCQGEVWLAWPDYG